MTFSEPKRLEVSPWVRMRRAFVQRLCIEALVAEDSGNLLELVIVVNEGALSGNREHLNKEEAKALLGFLQELVK